METKKNVWEQVAETDEIMAFAEDYKIFLSTVKTERESVAYLEEVARKNGYQDLKEVAVLKEGVPFYFNHRNKGFFMGVKREPLEKGLRLIASHIDTPRLDIKGKPLYEEDGLALFKTHYYGGVKKYHWVAMPLALHGVVITQDGESITITIGEKEEDPVFTITDLLPHLGREQMEKTMSKGIKGEQLNVLVGSRPLKGENEEKTPIKAFILDYLKTHYNIEEKDFLRSELEIVPNFKARDVGFDRSMIGGYGQDDRICSYTLLRAFNDSEKGERNLLACFFDKEEIGSNGDTGAQSRMIEYIVSLLAKKSGEVVAPLEVLYQSKGLSADVAACEDPNHKGVLDPHNRLILGEGVGLTKYTGSGGKYDSNDASAEFVGEVMAIFDGAEVVYQSGELGKVDQGGGGTIASYLSQLGMEIVDVGTGLLGMHSPYEVCSKADLWMTYQGYKAFLEQ